MQLQGQGEDERLATAMGPSGSGKSTSMHLGALQYE